MRSFALLLLGMACVANASAHSILPLNAAANGGFENGYTGWTLAGIGSGSAPISLVSPGAEGTAKAVMMPNAPVGYFLMQSLAAIAPGASVLDFSAMVTANGGNPGVQQVMAIANWHPSGSGDITARVSLGNNNQVLLEVYGGAPVSFPAPSAGAWHHYQVVLAGAVGTGVLLIDLVPVGTATGDPASVTPANRIIVGDTAGYDVRTGAAPSVAWDEIYYGP